MIKIFARRPSDLPLRHRFLLVFSLHLLLSLVFCFVIFPQLSDATAGLDPDGYGSAGRELYLTGRFTSISRAPLYPAFIAGVAFISGGYTAWAIQAAQCLLSAFACTVLYAIFRRALPGEKMAFFAALACAVYPMSMWYVPRLWTETFLTLVTALFTLALVRFLQEPGYANALWCGCLAGLAALSKGIALVFIPLTILVLLLYFRSSALRWMALFSGAALLIITPWTWRNWQLTKQFIPIHIDGGLNFYLGNGFARHWREAPFSYAGLKALTVVEMEQTLASSGIQLDDPVDRDQFLLSAALNELAADPCLALKKVLVQSLTFWYLAADFSKSALTGALQIPLVLLAIPGIIRALRERSWALGLLVPIVGIMGMSVIVFAFARLSATIMPYVIALASYGWWQAFKCLKPE
jgi:4-amino-4-deoxy-L-arabinose transferase-like glycosyltransferase